MKRNRLLSKSLIALLGTVAIATSSQSVVLENNTGSMYLGAWKNNISRSIMPRYFEHISETAVSKSYARYNTPSLFSLSAFNTQKSWLTQPVYLDKKSIELLDSTSRLSFSFHSELIEAREVTTNSLLASRAFSSKNNKLSLKPDFVNQQLYAPGYTFSHGWTSLGVAAVFVQQNFIDESFGFMTLEAKNSSTVYNDPVLYETSRGLGYQLNMSQQLPMNMIVHVDYHSKIEMNEFDTLGISYSQEGDYDLPENFSVSLSVPLKEKNSFSLKAQEIVYSDITANLHSGFSEDFLAVMNSPVRPSFEWDDLIVYSASYEWQVNKDLNVNLGVTSRQQASTLSDTLNLILDKDTADYSYKFGFSKQLAGGQLDFFTSYADKPVFIGRTDFGRYLTNLDKHFEAGFSWKNFF